MHVKLRALLRNTPEVNERAARAGVRARATTNATTLRGPSTGKRSHGPVFPCGVGGGCGSPAWVASGLSARAAYAQAAERVMDALRDLDRAPPALRSWTAQNPATAPCAWKKVASDADQLNSH